MVHEFTEKDWKRFKSGSALRGLKKQARETLIRNAIQAEAIRKREMKQIQDYMLCPNIKKRLLRRWKGTPLEVKTLSRMFVHQRPVFQN